MKRLLAVFLFFSVALPAQSALRIEVTEGTTSAIPIAVVPFNSGGSSPETDIANVVHNDLGSTALFKLLPRDKMLGQPSERSEVNYKNWRTAGVDYLVVGKATPMQGGYAVRFELLDVYSPDRVLAAFEIEAPSGSLRRAGHMIANRVYEALTGHKGVFTTRIAYVTLSKQRGGINYELVVADQDGYNPQVIASSPEPIMSPAWSPDGRNLAYVAFDIERGLSILQVQDVATGRVEAVSAREGINGAPSWSPDGRYLAMTLSYHGNPDVFIYDTRTRDVRQLTRSPAIDTEASWSPDGKHLVFTSDRGGGAQIYRVPASGGKAERLTFQGKNNQRAVYSPDGKSIAVVQGGNGYRIAIMDLKTRNMRILTNGPLDESPSFAPNGQVLIYTKSGRGGAELATISVDGDAKTRLTQRGEVREPAWSPMQ
ncbi:MAG: Tol-Pal system beta propeller repeat protein TolB [Salinisphaeraceae bacterium]|nr:Tol-Pal system beta propeller repeat protein TolB [Salinisphaeraceae bacterium]